MWQSKKRLARAVDSSVSSPKSFTYTEPSEEWKVNQFFNNPIRVFLLELTNNCWGFIFGFVIGMCVMGLLIRDDGTQWWFVYIAGILSVLLLQFLARLIIKLSPL